MPQAISLTRHQGMEALELVSPDGGRATVLLHGAHVVSWLPAGGQEQLYVSPKTAYANGQAIRGGVPVCFPQFSDRGTLPKHGFGRTRPWQLVSAEKGKFDALAVLRLSDDAATRLLWPHSFEAELSVMVHGRTLQIELAVENKGQEGDSPFNFTAALHSYFGVNDIDETSVAGLSGLKYFDAVDKTEKMQRVDLLLPGGELDRVYYGVKQDLTLKEQGITAARNLIINQQGFEDAVVWNPGAERCATLADLPADAYRKYLCIEAAAIERPVVLEPGASWVGMQTMHLV